MIVHILCILFGLSGWALTGTVVTPLQGGRFCGAAASRGPLAWQATELTCALRFLGTPASASFGNCTCDFILHSSYSIAWNL